MTDQERITKLRDGTWDQTVVRGPNPTGFCSDETPFVQETANRIEELVKERDDLGRKLNTARYGQPDFAWSIHEEAMADLRAKLDKAVEALDMLVRDCEADYPPSHGAIKHFAIATLAEIKGESHE